MTTGKKTQLHKDVWCTFAILIWPFFLHVPDQGCGKETSKKNIKLIQDEQTEQKLGSERIFNGSEGVNPFKFTLNPS